MSAALIPCLEASVMFHIINLKQRGYIPDSLLKEAREMADLIASEGDTLLYGGNPGDAARLFNKLAKAIAILSFQPGGFKGLGIQIASSW